MPTPGQELRCRERGEDAEEPPRGAHGGRSEWQAETDPEKPSGRPAGPEQKAVPVELESGAGALRRPSDGRAQPRPASTSRLGAQTEARSGHEPHSLQCLLSYTCYPKSPRNLRHTHTHTHTHTQVKRALSRNKTIDTTTSETPCSSSPCLLSLNYCCPQKKRSHAP